MAADADAPTLDLDSSVAGDQTAGAGVGTEDTAIDLDITSALTDIDGSESLSIEISGVPTGATLTNGTFDATTGNWLLHSSDLTGLQITPAPDSGDDFQLTISATSTEATGGDSETVTGTIDVVVTADADAPDLSAPDVITIGDPSSGDETITGTSGDDTLIGGDDTISGLQGDDVIYGDSPDGGGGEIDDDGNIVAPLDITSALNDTDGSETLSITVSGVPSGAFLSAGNNNGDGSWTLTEAELTDLTVTVSPDNVDFQLTVDATATDTDPDTGLTDTATTTTTIDIDITGGGAAGSDTISGGEGADTIFGGAGADELEGDQGDDILDGGSGADTLSGGQGSDVLEGGSGDDVLEGGQGDDILDGGAGADIVDGGQGDDTASFTVGESGDGIDVYDGGQGVDALIVNLSEEDLSNPEMVAEMVALRTFIEENSDDTGASGPSQTFPTLGITVSNFEDLQFLVDGDPIDLDAAAPDLDVSAASGVEDSAIDLDISALLTDTDGSENLSIEISGVPAGASLNSGTFDAATGIWTLDQNDLTGLQIAPAANDDTDFSLSVSATATETLTGDTNTTTASIAVSVAADADAPTLDLDSTTAGDQSAGAAAGTEDQAIHLDITALLADTDGSESLSIEISDVPAGATLNNGVFDQQTGIWTLDSADLTGLQITPTANDDADFQLSVSATSTKADGGEFETVSGTIDISVAADADAPTLILQNAGGGEDRPIDLDITALLADTDGSESLSIEISGVPAGASLNNGNFDQQTGIWTLDPIDLAGLQVTPAPGSDADFQLSVSATSTETDGGDFETVSGTIDVTVGADADAPTLDLDSSTAGDQLAGAAAGDEDQAIDLDISAALADTDGSESLSIEISGVPAGASLNNGTFDVSTGNWTLEPGDLTGLQITPAADDDADFQLTVSATATESSTGATSTTTGTIDVSVAADADAPTLDLDSTTAGDQSAGTASGVEDSAITLDISSALTDTDGSESLSVTIWGVPTGALLNNGIDNQDGTWTLSAGDLEGLEITPASDDDTDFSLTVTTTATESDGGDQISVSGTIDVSVAADADAPTLILDGASGIEDQPIDLDITALLTDTDGSENLSIEISGVPEGATLNNGTFDSETGNWTLAPVDLTNLQVTPATDDDTDFQLSVTATATEADGGDTAIASGTIAVSVAADADAPTLDLDSATAGDQTTGTAGGSEDQTIDLDISSALVDTDGSESLSITIEGVPAGATLNNGTFDQTTGNWTLDANDLISPLTKSSLDEVGMV